jgi:hypothetical protein
MTQVTVNGQTYCDDGSGGHDLRNGGFRLWLLKLIADVMTRVAGIDATAARFLGTSSTSIVMGTGTKALVTQSGKRFDPGTFVTIPRQGSPAVGMYGKVLAYNSVTGALSVDVLSFDGSGTFSDWNIYTSGSRGAVGPVGGIAGGNMTGALNEKRIDSLTVSSSPDIWSMAGNTIGLIGSGPVTNFPTAPLAGAERKLLLTQGGQTVTFINGGNLFVMGGTLTASGNDEIDVKAIGTNYFRVQIRRGTGLAPVAQAPTMALLGTAVISGAPANVDFLNVFTADYDYYVIVCNNLTPSAISNQLRIQVARAGAVDADANYYMSSSAVTSGQVMGSVSATRLFSGKIEVFGANSGGAVIQVDGTSRQGNVPATAAENISYGSTGPLSGFRLFWSAGANFLVGTVRVYGVRNAAGLI